MYAAHGCLAQDCEERNVRPCCFLFSRYVRTRLIGPAILPESRLLEDLQLDSCSSHPRVRLGQQKLRPVEPPLQLNSCGVDDFCLRRRASIRQHQKRMPTDLAPQMAKRYVGAVESVEVLHLVSGTTPPADELSADPGSLRAQVLILWY